MYFKTTTFVILYRRIKCSIQQTKNNKKLDFALVLDCQDICKCEHNTKMTNYTQTHENKPRIVSHTFLAIIIHQDIKSVFLPFVCLLNEKVKNKMKTEITFNIYSVKIYRKDIASIEFVWSINSEFSVNNLNDTRED